MSYGALDLQLSFVINYRSACSLPRMADSAQVPSPAARSILSYPGLSISRLVYVLRPMVKAVLAAALWAQMANLEGPYLDILTSAASAP